jgi:hypothetical protein
MIRIVLPVDPAGAQQDKECEWGRQRVHSGSVRRGGFPVQGLREWGYHARSDWVEVRGQRAASDRVDPPILEDPASTQFPHTTGSLPATVRPVLAGALPSGFWQSSGTFWRLFVLACVTQF